MRALKLLRNFFLLILLGFLSNTLYASSASKIYIYQAADMEVEPLRRLFSSHPVTKIFSIETMDQKALHGNWQENTSLIVFPGGTASYYDEQLGKSGRKIIADFIHSGGSALFICAGAYWASSQTEFVVSTEIERIVEREPSIYSGTAKGPLIPYSYTDRRGAAMIDIYYERAAESVVLYFGGPSFAHKENKNIENLIYYDERRTQPAVIKVLAGKGVAVLSGIHFEEDGKTDTSDKHLADLFKELEIRRQSIHLLADYLMKHLFKYGIEFDAETM